MERISFVGSREEQRLNPRRSAEELLALIKTRFVRADGLLARHYPASTRTLFDNFDDLAPFFLYYGEAPFLLDQVRSIRKQGQGFASLCADEGALVTSRVDEWFGGLYALWKHTGDRDTWSILEESVRYALSNLIEGSFLSAAYYPSRNRRAPYYEPWSAGLLETFCEMRSEFPEAFDKAQRILRSWLSEDYFATHGLFPYRVFRSPMKRLLHRHFLPVFPRRRRHTAPVGLAREGLKGRLRHVLMRARFETTCGYYSQMMKANSTPAFTLLEFHKATGDRFWLQHLERWVKSAIQVFCGPGRSGEISGNVWGEYHPLLSMGRDAGVNAGSILVDVLCDAAAFAGSFRTHLPAAGRILDFYWDGRLKNGLVPHFDGAPFAHLDSQIDFAISMRRYGELTADPRYLVRSIELTQQALATHYTKEGYLTFSGDVSRVRQVIDPKYNALALKGLIHLETASERLYPDFQTLFKDR